jgi:hypothetical protein
MAGTSGDFIKPDAFNEFILAVGLRQIRIGRVLANTGGSDRTRISVVRGENPVS